MERAPSLTTPASGLKQRVTIITNGNFFSCLGLRDLLSSGVGDLDFQVFITTGLRKPTGNRAQEAILLVRRWGVRYAFYKAVTYIAPALGEAVGRRSLFVRSLCGRLGIVCHIARNVNVPTVSQKIRDFEPELIVSFSCPYKIGNEILSMPTIGSLNVHSSLLPAYAGVCTYVHVLADGQSETGVTIHEMVGRFDAGGIVAQSRISIDGPTSVFQLFMTQCRVAGQLLNRAVRDCLASGVTVAEPQDLTRRSYRKEPTRHDVRRLRQRGHRLLRIRDLGGLLFGPAVEGCSHHVATAD